MYELIKKLTACYGPSGREGDIADAIEALVKPHVDETRRDALGNLICVKRGTAKQPKRVMLSAHMDQIGYIVTSAEKDGFLRVAPVGGIHIDNSRARHVRFQNGAEGALLEQALKPGEKSELRCFYIDIGAASAEEALKKVALGDMAVIVSECYRMGEHRVVSPALDNRSACALLITLLTELKSAPNTIIAVFSTQEEVGLRGATVAAYAAEPDIGVALDVTMASDVPEGSKQIAVRLGEGPAVKIMDRASISNPALVAAITAAAKRAKVKLQREVLPFGGTDAGAMQQSRGGMPVVTLSLPCRYVHSPCECVDLRDLEGAVKVLKEYLK